LTDKPEIWLPKQQAADRAGIGERQVRRYVAEGRVRRKIESGQAIVCVNDLIRVKNEQALALLPRGHDRRASPSPLSIPAAPASDAADGLIPEGSRPRIWCTLDEAAAWSGLPKFWLRRAAEVGSVRAIDVSSSPARHVWRIHRDELSEAKPIVVANHTVASSASH
jgi:hypothetical protein